MDWLAPINTLIGAVVGVGATLLADRVRWRRERIRLSREARQQAYAAFMGALAAAYQAIYGVARARETAAGERAAAAHDAFQASNLYTLRYQLVLIAPWEVVEPTNHAFWKVRDLSDLAAAGATVDGKDFRELQREYIAAAEEAQVCMRRDLGTAWNRPEDEGSRKAG